MSLGRSKCDESYETRLVRMSQTTDIPCLALNIQESVLDLAMKTRTGWHPLTARSTARRITTKTPRYAPFYVIHGSLYCKDSITRHPPYAASVQVRLVQRISDMDIRVSIQTYRSSVLAALLLYKNGTFSRAHLLYDLHFSKG